MTTYMRPPYLVGRIVNPLVAAVGAKPALATRGQRSGRWRTVPVNVLERDGRRYVVSTRGESFWVRNLRHSPEAELRRRGRSEPIRATLVPESEWPVIITAYLQRWHGEAGSYFERLPDAADHPVFELEPTGS